MMNILVAYPLFRPFASWWRERLGPGHSLRFVSPAQCDEAAAPFGDVDVLVTSRFPRAWGPRFPALKLLHAAGAGIDRIAASALPPAGRLCRTFGHGRGIAEYVVMVMLALGRNLLPADRALRGGRWLNPLYDPRVPLAGSLAQRTVVVLGTGEIGAAIAELGRALSMSCIGLNRTGRPPPATAFVKTGPLTALPEVLPEADFLVVALPLTGETRGLLGRELLGRLRPGACVINVARGPIIEETALFEALRDRRLAGAALDVWYSYPGGEGEQAEPSSLPFRDLENVIMTPHLAGFTQDTFRHRAADIAENILALAAGGTLRNEVDRRDRVDVT